MYTIVNLRQALVYVKQEALNLLFQLRLSEILIQFLGIIQSTKYNIPSKKLLNS